MVGVTRSGDRLLAPVIGSGPLAGKWRRHLSGAMSWSPPATTMIVVVPHPDDEVVGCGGLIATARSAGTEVHVLAVTDGEAAYDGQNRDELAAVRRREQQAALTCLGVGAESISRLGIPDGRVAEHEADITASVVETIRRTDAGLLIAPWRFDHHCDHEATGRAVSVAGEHECVPVLSTIFWGWQHALPSSVTGPTLRLDLDEDAMGARSEALSCHRSQTARDEGWPILDAGDLEPMTWTAEFLLAPSGPETM